MQWMNKKNSFGLIAKLFHWVMAILIIGMLFVGIYMVDLPVSLQKVQIYGWHKAFGSLILGLALLRLVWRWMNVAPELSLPLFEKIAARLVHWTFYGFMLAMPLSGWLMSSASGLPVSFFGLFTMPDLIAPNQIHAQFFQFVHHWLGFALLATIFLHIAAALKHHFIDKDDILRRML